MKQLNINKQNQLWLILGILGFILLVIIVVKSIIDNSLANATPKIRIENWSEELPDVPQATRINIEERLYSQIKENLATNNDAPNSGAKIRKDSLHSVKLDSSYVDGDFIVDIPKIEQSYIVNYSYGQLDEKKATSWVVGTPDSASIFCITNPSDKIYPNFNCKNASGIEDVRKFLDNSYFSLNFPHTGTLTDGREFTVSIRSSNDKNIKLIITVDNCGNESIMKEAENKTKQWVKSLNYYNESAIIYFVPLEYNNCLVR